MKYNVNGFILKIISNRRCGIRKSRGWKILSSQIHQCYRNSKDGLNTICSFWKNINPCVITQGISNMAIACDQAITGTLMYFIISQEYCKISNDMGNSDSCMPSGTIKLLENQVDLLSTVYIQMNYLAISISTLAQHPLFYIINMN